MNNLLITNRLHLRQLRESDNLQLAALRSDAQVNTYLERKSSCTIEEANAFIAARNSDIANGSAFYWAICLKNSPDLIGTICLFSFNNAQATAEIGYELLPDFQGQGFMHEALQAVIAFGYDALNLQKIVAYISANNQKSINAIQKHAAVEVVRL